MTSSPRKSGCVRRSSSVGNGYFCTRGSFSWTEAAKVHYPGTYTHGGFNWETTIMAGVPVLIEDLVNLPNWLLLEMRIEGEEAVGDDNVELLSYRHELEIRNAVLKRTLRIRDRADRETIVEARRFVSTADAQVLVAGSAVYRGELAHEMRKILDAERHVIGQVSQDTS